MLQMYSDGISVAAGAAVPFNNIVYYKGDSATHSAPATAELNKRGIYTVHVDAYGSVAAAGDFGIQLAVNGVPRVDAISEVTATVGDLATASFSCVVSVAQTNCPCNCTSAPTTIQLLNSSDVGSTDAHYNMLITKLC